VTILIAMTRQNKDTKSFLGDENAKLFQSLNEIGARALRFQTEKLQNPDLLA
jgi:hypothetical protein